MQKNQYLLIEDVDGLGKSGEVVENIKPGFLRNFLLPKGKVTRAGTHTIKRQEKLQKERAEQAKSDLEESMKLASKLETVNLEVEVEVNQEGDMYGSITAVEVLHLLEEKGYHMNRKMIRLPLPLKKIGEHIVPLKLKEDVDAQMNLKIKAKGAPIKEEKKAEESTKAEEAS